MPFIIPPTANNHQYENFKCLIEKYRNSINNNPTSHCLIGFTAASILRNDDSANLYLFEDWLKSLEPMVTGQETDKTDQAIDQILSTFDNCYQQHEDTLEEVTNDGTEEPFHESSEDETYYELKRYASHTPYSTHSHPIHNYQPKYSFVYDSTC